MSDTNEHSEVVAHVEDLSQDLQHLDLQGAEVDPDETKLEEPQQIRCLIENNQVGGIIGKAGANVKKVREETNVFLSILKAESPSVKERIMVLKGSVLQISQALRMIADLLIEAASQREQSTEHGASIKLLVHRYTVGAIIGKGGAVIKQTQQDTETKIQISQEPLAQSTEKSVTMTGTSDAIENAMLLILEQLASSPLRPGTKNYPYSPSAPGPMFPGYLPQAAFYGQAPLAPYMPSGGGGGGGGAGAGGIMGQPGMGAGMGPAGTSSTQKIAIPTVCAGCVIGKGGAVIRDIRIQSQTNISIADAEQVSPGERVVTLSGSQQGIQTAIYLIRQLVEQYQPQVY